MKKFLIPLAALGLLASAPAFAAPVVAAEGGAQGSAGPQHGATLAAAEGGAILRQDQRQAVAYADPAAPRLLLAEANGGGELNSHVNGQPQEA